MAIVPPSGDQSLAAWSNNFSAKISATPTAYGLVAADATAYAALKTDFDARLATSTNPDTRTRGSIAAKNTSRAALLARTRQLVRIVEAYPPLTAAQRADLGLNPKDVTPSPVPAPSTRPLVALAADGSMRLVDETTPTRRARPTGVKGAVVLAKIAPASEPAPTQPDQTGFSALVTRSKHALALPAGSTGKVLYVFARWYNERGELGPVSTIASTLIAA